MFATGYMKINKVSIVKHVFSTGENLHFASSLSLVILI